jgi:hypothetical protein
VAMTLNGEAGSTVWIWIMNTVVQHSSWLLTGTQRCNKQTKGYV